MRRRSSKIPLRYRLRLLSPLRHFCFAINEYRTAWQQLWQVRQVHYLVLICHRQQVSLLLQSRFAPVLPPLPPMPPLPADGSLPPLPPPQLPDFSQPPAPLAAPAPLSGAVTGDVFGDTLSEPQTPPAPAPAPEPGQYRIPGQ